MLRNIKPSEQLIDELIKTIRDIQLIMEDNNQNAKDCLRILRDIHKRLVPKKTLWQKLQGLFC